MANCWERAVPLDFHLCCLYFSAVWCLGQDVEFDCFGSWSLPFYLLNFGVSTLRLWNKWHGV